jgi:ADP-ribose pyrophosphatase YjhB (NUDIX family)
VNGEAGQTVLLLRAGSRPHVRIQADAPVAASHDVLRRWDEMRRDIPRLFNAPVLSVVDINQDSGLITCRRDTYQRLVVQPEVATGVEQLSVTGILTAREGDDTAILLGKRSTQTRMYAGMWELGPAGGVDAPPPEATEISHEALAGELVREVREESGLEIDAAAARAVAIVHDAIAFSHDVVFAVDLGGMPAANADNWEYDATRWVRQSEIERLLAEEGDSIIPPSRVLLSLISHGRILL